MEKIIIIANIRRGEVEKAHLIRILNTDGNLWKFFAKVDITAEEFKKWMYGKWSIAPERGIVEKYGHPAMFPEELARRVLKLFSFRGDFVLRRGGRNWSG